MKPYDTAITLSHELLTNGMPTREMKQRLNCSIKLYTKRIANTLSMTGGLINAESPSMYTKVMVKYAIAQGVAPEAIFKEEESLDTVGQAIFIKRDIVRPNNWKRLIVTTSDYHIRRATAIFDFVFGREFEIKYVSVPTSKIVRIEHKARECASLGAFVETFKGIRRANDKDIESRLYEQHPLYKTK